MRQSDLAWAAGIVDGEGCFSIASQKGKGNRPKYYYLQTMIRVAMTHKGTVERLHKLFGGSFTPHIKKPDRWGRKRKLQHLWVSYGPLSKTVTQLLLPFLFTKKRQAQHMVRCREYLEKRAERPSGRGLHLTSWDVKKRKCFALRMQELNA